MNNQIPLPPSEPGVDDFLRQKRAIELAELKQHNQRLRKELIDMGVTEVTEYRPRWTGYRTSYMPITVKLIALLLFCAIGLQAQTNFPNGPMPPQIVINTNLLHVNTNPPPPAYWVATGPITNGVAITELAQTNGVWLLDVNVPLSVEVQRTDDVTRSNWCHYWYVRGSAVFEIYDTNNLPCAFYRAKVSITNDCSMNASNNEAVSSNYDNGQ